MAPSPEKVEDMKFFVDEQELNEPVPEVVSSSGAPPPAAVPPLVVATVPLAVTKTAVTAGKGPSQFHLTPSKKAPKLDLGEAYLRSQEQKLQATTAIAQARSRTDLVIALAAQNKSAAEISAFLTLCGV